MSLAKSSRAGRLSSTREFFAVCKSASSDIPPEGWNFANFLSDAGRRLIRNLASVKRAVMLRGIRALAPFLKAYFSEQIDGVIDKASYTHAHAVASPQAAFASAIADTFTATEDAMLAAKVQPLIQSIAAESASKTSLLLGSPAPSSHTILTKSREIAAGVTAINGTTRKRLESEVAMGVAERVTFDELCEQIRARKGAIADSRVTTISRQTIGDAADAGALLAYQNNGNATHYARIGCSIISDAPTWHGVATCGICGVPAADVPSVPLHIGCTGIWIPSAWRLASGEVPNPPLLNLGPYSTLPEPLK